MKDVKTIFSKIYHGFKEAFTWEAFWHGKGVQHFMYFLSAAYLLCAAVVDHNDDDIDGVVNHFFKYMVIFIVAYVIGGFLEYLQTKISEGTKASYPDMIWGALGAVAGVGYFNAVGVSLIEIIVSAAILVLLTIMLIMSFKR